MSQLTYYGLDSTLSFVGSERKNLEHILAEKTLVLYLLSVIYKTIRVQNMDPR